MGFSEWNSLLPNCIKLGLPVQADLGDSGMSTQFNASLKAAHSGSQCLMLMGIFQTHFPLSATFQFHPQAWNSITMLKH